MSQSSADVAKRMIEIDESLREISSLDELYAELVNSKPGDERERSLKLDEAKFAGERILKLSLHVKNLLGNVEAGEPIK
ncbi:hypothetical protein HZB90_00215 [archaeon]|nr:hypothetical protein [archaeon]